MQKALLATLVASLLLLGPVEYSFAQRGGSTVRVAPVPPPLDPQARFRTRSAAARAADASRLGFPVSAAQMGAPFSITPRAPFIPNRATLQAVSTDLDAGFDTTGRLRGQTNDHSDVQIRIYNTANHRFLVDCKVSTIVPLPFRMIAVGGAPGNQAVVSDVYPSGGMVSFVTQNIPNTALIGLSPPPHPNDIYPWDFMGCEVTPLPS